MIKNIKYKRFKEIHDEESIQKLFDQLVKDNWEIIYYNERIIFDNKIEVTIVGSKKQSDRL